MGWWVCCVVLSLPMGTGCFVGLSTPYGMGLALWCLVVCVVLSLPPGWGGSLCVVLRWCVWWSLGGGCVLALGASSGASIRLPLRRSVDLGGSNCLSFGKYQIDMVYINVYVSAEVLDKFIIVVLYDAHVFYCPSMVFV